ncbi:CPBP family intramembrane metalloprotease [Candidatus Saccharibacteria bacterium]|nr:CPBP family intramembrane metalloprotease [Candidatus Saccharibacteria bacterium]
MFSFALIYVFEKTQNLWAAIVLHALKNGIAFVGLFILS